MTTRQDECSRGTKDECSRGIEDECSNGTEDECTSDRDLEWGTAPQPASSSLDLMSDGNSETYLKFGVPLIRAALNGDWVTASCIIEVFPEFVSARITANGETILHIAAAAKNTKFAIELVRKMHCVEHLALQTINGDTALCYAAISGQVEIAKAMVERYPNLIMLRTETGKFPLSLATEHGSKDMTWFLYRVTNENDLTPDDRIRLLINMINNNLYDVALDMLQNHLELATARGPNGETALHALARRKPLKTYTFDNQSQKGVWWRRCTKFFSGMDIVNGKICMHPKALEIVRCLWQQIILSNNSQQISQLIGYPWRILSVAAELGNVNFIVALIRSYPDLIWKVDDETRSIFHIAVLNRQENIFSLIYEIGAVKDFITTCKDDKQNNMLHLAGMLPPRSRLNILSGAALQMQQELLWFKEVEKVVPPLYVESENADGHTPQALFSITHEELMKQGETWMKETAGSCMLVATLVATMMFAATFTLPGGNNDDTGIPIYRKTVAFMFFSISDAIGLLSSSFSILSFLSIFTSRYAEEDFLESLPRKLIIGIATLFVSVAAMMVAFCSSFVIVFYHGLEWVVIPIALVACVPVISFGFLQYQLLSDIKNSMYRSYKSRYLFLPTKHKLF